MMPTTAAGYRNLPAAAAGHARSVLQILSRTGGTLGTTLMTVILTQHVAAAERTPVSLTHAYDVTF